MRTIKAIVERANDGGYSVYMDAKGLTYLITGTGHTAEEAIQCFKDGYEDTRRAYVEEGLDFEEVNFDFHYDAASFLSYYSKTFSLAGLSRITGINKERLSHYATGRSVPTSKTRARIQNSIRGLGKELRHATFLAIVMLFTAISGAKAQASYNVTYTEGVSIAP